ncbi:MAG: efflux RND transporter periplasmic adaptor subunit, partial [Pseudomonadota bacterium]
MFKRLLCFFAATLFLSPVFAEDSRLAKIIPVTLDDGNVTRTFFGRVVAKQTVDYAFQVSGQIAELPVVEGDTIEEGATIAKLDQEPFQLALDQAQAQKNQADRALARNQRLQNTVSRVALEDAQTNAELSDIALRNAQRDLNNASLYAPFEALVATRNFDNFSTVSAGTPVVRLHDMSELRIEIEVPEILFQRAGEDPDVELWVTFPTSDTRYALETREFNAETSAVGQTFRITLGLPRPPGLVALPGSSATVTATLKGGAPSIVIPRSAVLTRNDGSTQVMVFEPAGADEGAVSAVDISITPTDSGGVAVVSGLSGGEEIIASGAAA